jgi:hypothetical protein
MTVFVYVNANKQVAAAVMKFTDIRVLEIRQALQC